MVVVTLYTQINDLINSIYKDIENNDNYVNLARFVSDWETDNPDTNSIDTSNLFANLQKLEDYLNKNSLTEYSEKISRILIQNFPELLFPELPNPDCETIIDLKPLQDVKTVMRMRNYPDSAKEAFRQFDENFRKALDNSVAFSKDVSIGHFRELGSGVAGELFRHLKATVTALDDPKLADIPWQLINQLALKINNDISDYKAAHLLLKNLDNIKTARPSADIGQEIKKHSIFFQRNLLWDNLDKAINSKNFRDVIKTVDRLVPLVNSTAERANLRLMKKNALEKIEGSPRGCIIIIISLIIVSGIISLFNNKSFSKRSTIKTKVPLNRVKKQTVVEPIKHKQFKGRSGLIEELPPIQPYDKPLSLPQIRYAMYQQQRITYLKSLKLSPSEEKQLDLLIKDWKKRCEFYKYNVRDREKIDFEVKNYKNLLLIDANNILKEWRKHRVSYSKKLLDLSIPIYASKVQLQLAKYGFYHGKISGIWDAASKRALAEFKASTSGSLNSNWNIKTQKRLFSGN